MKQWIREGSLLLAFVVLGGILLISLWMTRVIRQSIFDEFENAKISLTLKGAASLEPFLAQDRNILDIEVFSASDNKTRLQRAYPELKEVIDPLESDLFPASAIVTVKDANLFLEKIKRRGSDVEAHLLHEPPRKLQALVTLATVVFSCLWLMTLGLVLYFNLEGLALREEARWSLMKMLGARPTRLFWPLLYGQAGRIGAASLIAVVVAWITISQIRGLFAFTWGSIGAWMPLGFIAVALLLTGVFCFALFFRRFRSLSIA